MKFSFSRESQPTAVELDRAGLIECLKTFSPFDTFGDDELILLSTRSHVETVPNGHRLFEVGDDDPWIFCLLEGSVCLVADDGRTHQLDAGTKSAQQPVAQLKPRKYAAVTTTPGRCVRIDGTGFGEFAAGVDVRDYFVTEIMEESTVGSTNPHFRRLREGDLELPSLPEVAMETCRVMRHDEPSIANLAQVVSRDVAITAKLVRAANSPIYYGREPVQTCERALLRLGMNATHQLVLAFSARELFKAKSVALKQRMQLLWNHSTEVAAISRVLARAVGGFDPDEAQLAGLLHDIGAVPIISYAQNESDLSDDPESLDALIGILAGEIGARLLRSWNLPEHLSAVVSESENWWRDTESSAQLVDLVLVAQLLSFIGKRTPPDVPNISRLPAFTKVAGGKLDPASVLALIHEAEKDIADTRALLRG